VAAAKRRRPVGEPSARRQVTDTVLRLLGGVPLQTNPAPAVGTAFGAPERQMVGGVLSLGERQVAAIMTPRADMVWLDMDEPDILATLRASPHREFPVCRSSIDAIEGIVRKEDLLAQGADGKPIDVKAVLRAAQRISPRASVLDLLAQLKRTTAEMAVVQDKAGRVHGLVTRTDLLEAIAGEFPDEGE
jgi:CBS domain containing-hemolysin-like protein